MLLLVTAATKCVLDPGHRTPNSGHRTHPNRSGRGAKGYGNCRPRLSRTFVIIYLHTYVCEWPPVCVCVCVVMVILACVICVHWLKRPEPRPWLLAKTPVAPDGHSELSLALAMH